MVVVPSSCVIDTANDSVSVVRDAAERCGYSFSVVEGTDGLYVGTESFGAAQRALSATSAAPCMLRLDPDTLTFDADYQVALEPLVGDIPAGTLVPGSEPGKAYLRALDFAKLGYTIETPSSLPLTRRIAALTAAIEAALRMLCERPA